MDIERNLDDLKAAAYHPGRRRRAEAVLSERGAKKTAKDCSPDLVVENRARVVKLGGDPETSRRTR